MTRRPRATVKALDNLRDVCVLAQAAAEEIDGNTDDESRHAQKVVDGVEWLWKLIAAEECKQKSRRMQ